jgi:hypothetical protein
MHAKATPTPAEQNARTDRLILWNLLDDPPGLWSLDELGLELGGRMRAEEGVYRLHAAGLVHQLSGEFVIPTRAVIRADKLDL